MKKISPPTRTCAACGIEKPLSAFLHVSGAQGAMYGAFCSACRGSNLAGKSEKPTPDEEKRTTSSGISIGIKEKVAMEKEKTRKLEETQSAHEVESKKREKLLVEKGGTLETIEKEEKSHRKNYIENKAKSGFLHHRTLHETGKKVTRTAPITSFGISNETEILTKAHDDAAVQHNERMTSVDASIPFLTTQFSEGRFNTASFLSFIHLLSGASPLKGIRKQPAIIKSLEQLAKDAPIPAPTRQTIWQSKPEKKEDKNPIIELIHQTMGPSKKR